MGKLSSEGSIAVISDLLQRRRLRLGNDANLVPEGDKSKVSLDHQLSSLLHMNVQSVHRYRGRVEVPVRKRHYPEFARSDLASASLEVAQHTFASSP